MNKLTRTVVDKFKIEEAIDFESLEKNKSNVEFLNKNLVTMEQIFKGLPKIILNIRKEELFLNGVMLTFEKEEGLYNIYNSEDNYLGTGTIKNRLLKRDIII